MLAPAAATPALAVPGGPCRRPRTRPRGLCGRAAPWPLPGRASRVRRGLDPSRRVRPAPDKLRRAPAARHHRACLA